MSKPGLAQLQKLLRAYRDDGLVNIARKDGITTISAMHEDHVSMLVCAQNTGGKDYDELVLADIELDDDKIQGDKQDGMKPLKMPRLPDICDRTIDVKLLGKTLADPVKKHAAAMKCQDLKTKKWICFTRFDFRCTRMVLCSRESYIPDGTEVITTRQYIPETGRLLNQHFDTVMLTKRIFRHLTPVEITLKIQAETYPLELTFWVGSMQCYYVQSPMVVI
jgi:hypothetical protein